MDDESLKQYLADSPPTVVKLEIKPHFEALTSNQKFYAHHISRASHYGTRIILRQVSPESEDIFNLIIALYKGCNGDWTKLKDATKVSDQDLKYFLEYSCQFLGNLGNYKGFGDSKFVPRLSPSALESLVSTTPEAKRLFDSLGGKDGALFADIRHPALMHLGFPDQGHMSTYYPDSPDITKEEIELVGAFISEKELLPENTRLKKLTNGNFELLVASGTTNPPIELRDAPGGETTFDLDGKLKGRKLKVMYGDYLKEMGMIVMHMRRAKAYAANDTQSEMIEEYAKSFATGSLKTFKKAQVHWVKDIGPAVESNIGFIESYRDPAGVRSEWEGFAAMVNKERTKAFQKLVEAAPRYIKELPWSKDFEKEEFVPPDFTSLEVLAFASTGIPAGINIPNYDDIRQNVGFKNVSLGNVLNAKAPDEMIPFIHPDDLQMYRDLRDKAFEVQVGLHELLGHGSGALLQETSPGKFNFDNSNPPTSPVTGKPVSTYYKPGETWSSVFGAISSSYEECRAECVAMVLSCDFEVLRIFGFGDGKEDMRGKAGDVLLTGYISMARAGIAALEFWDPKSRKWGQAHMQARFSILKVMLAAGGGLVSLDHEKDDLSDLVVRVDRTKIMDVGRPAIADYLQKLHVFKATADVEAGKKLYNDATHVDSFWAEKVRPVVQQKKPPRKVHVQANTFEENGTVTLKEYEGIEGMIQSYVERQV